MLHRCGRGRRRLLVLAIAAAAIVSSCSSDPLAPAKDAGSATDAVGAGPEAGVEDGSASPTIPPDALAGADAAADVSADLPVVDAAAAVDTAVSAAADAPPAGIVDAFLEDATVTDTSGSAIDVAPDLALDAAEIVPTDAAVVVDPDAAVVPADLAPDQGKADRPPCQPGSCPPTAEWVRIATAEADLQTNTGGSSVVGVAGGDLYLSATFRRNAVVAGQPVTNMSALDHTDAFVASFSPVGSLQWIRQVHGENDESINDVTPDPAGNLLMTGGYLATMYVDDLYTHGQGLWVSRLNGAGKAAWLKTGDSYPTTNYSVAGDAAGNLYLCGFYTTLIQFDDQKLTGDASNKLFVASLGPDRKVRWLRDLGQTFMPSIVVRGVDDIVVAGSYLQLRLDGQTWSARGLWDVFFVALGAGGVPRWTTVFPGPAALTGRGTIRGLGVDSTGAVYASGEFADPSGVQPATVVALSPAGALKWSISTSSIGAAPVSTALTVGNDDAIYYSARIAGNVSFGDWTFTHANDTYVVRFDTDGRVRWVLDFGNTPTFPAAVAALPGGRIGLAGIVQDQSALLGLPLRPDQAAVPTALYLLSLKQQ
jgi:hypothetical protein